MERVVTREIPSFDFSVECVSGEDLKILWPHVEPVVTKAFSQAEFIGANLAKVIERAGFAISDPQIRYLLALGVYEGENRVLGGVLGLPISSTGQKLSPANIGSIFVDPDLPPNKQVNVAEQLAYNAHDELYAHGYTQLIANKGIRANVEAFALARSMRPSSACRKPYEWIGEVRLSAESPPLEKIEAFLDTNEALDHILANKAARMARDAARFKLNGERPTGSYPLTDADFERLYDGTASTLIVDARTTLRNSEIAAQAAQLFREQDEETAPKLNVVFAFPDTSSVMLATTVQGEEVHSSICVTHGILVDADGNTYAGEFPQLVFSDMFETNSVPLLKQCEKQRVATLTDSETFIQHEYKQNIDEIAAAAGMKSPKRLPKMPDSHQDLLRDIVIKPSYQSGAAIGVRVYSCNTFPIIIKAALVADGKDRALPHYKAITPNNKLFAPQPEEYSQFLKYNGYEPYYEEYVESFPIYDETTGERLTWSIRHNIAAGSYLGSYLRVNLWREPTNVTQGARSCALEDLYLMVDDEATAATLITRIQDDGERLARVVASDSVGKGGPAGVDEIINEDKESYFIELNFGQVGGLNKQVALAPPTKKLGPYKKLFTAILEKTGSRPSTITPDDIIYQEAAERNIVTIFKGLYDSGNLAAFATLTKKEIATFPVGRHFAYWLWIKARLLVHNETEGQLYEMKEIITDALETTPLSFLENLDTIVKEHYRPDYFHGTVSNLAGQWPEFGGTLEYIQKWTQARYLRQPSAINNTNV